MDMITSDFYDMSIVNQPQFFCDPPDIKFWHKNRGYWTIPIIIANDIVTNHKEQRDVLR